MGHLLAIDAGTGGCRDVRAVSAASVRGGLVLLDGAGCELWAYGSTMPERLTRSS